VRAELSIAGLVGYEMLKFSDQVRPRYIGHLQLVLINYIRLFV
jgi:hypothetical protein